MSTKTDAHGKVVLNGDTFAQALEHLKAGRVPRESVAEWLIGRADIDVPTIAAECYKPGGLLKPDDLGFVVDGRQARAAAAAAAHAAETANKKPPQMSYEAFLASAPDIELAMDGADVATFKPRVFASGGFGWFAQLRPKIVVNGEELRTVASVSLSVVHSDHHPDAPKAKAYAKKLADAKASKGQRDE